MSKRQASKRSASQPAVSYANKQELGVTRERKNVIVDRELDRIHKTYGSVTPAKVLEEAESPNSPLHRYFEWDDSEAGHRYRLAQAAALLQASKMVVLLSQHSREPIAAFPEVRRLLPSARGDGKFKMRKEVLEEPDARQEVIERKLGVLRGWCRETIDIEELRSMREAILACLPGN